MKHNRERHTALSDGTSRSKVSVLTVHVVGATTGIISQPHSKVFDFQRFLLVNLF